MKTRALPLTLLLSAALSAPPRAHGDNLQSQQKALEAIAKFAAQICNDVPIRGEANSTDVKGDVNAKLSGLASKLAELGVSGAGSIKSEQYQGVLRSDLAAALKSSSDCKLAIFNSLQAKLLSPGSSGSEDAASRPNIGGVWRDAENPSIVTRVTQEGDRFEFTRAGTLPNGISFTSTGAGRVAGASYASEYFAQYRTGATSTGHCSGAVRDERLMTFACTDTLMREISGSLIRQ